MKPLSYKPWLHKATGYYYVRTRHADGRRRNMPYHRFLMEQHLGRSLATNEHVHHINEDKTDNRLENLEVRSASDHLAHHHSPERMKGAHRAINARTREERDEARLMRHLTGVSYAAIGRALNANTKTVWRWINDTERFGTEIADFATKGAA